MKYVLVIAGNEGEWETGERDPGAAPAYGRLRSWWEEQVSAGRVIGGHELGPTSTATTLRRRSGQIEVVDGPFAETKEAIGGFIVIDVPDLDAAIALARTWPGLDERCHALERTDAIEIRPVGRPGGADG